MEAISYESFELWPIEWFVLLPLRGLHKFHRMDRIAAFLEPPTCLNTSPVFLVDMEKAKGLQGIIERHDNYEQSMDRASYTTSIDGFSSHETLGDGDLSSSPIDLICDHTPRDASSSDDEPSPLGWPLARQPRSRLRLSPASHPVSRMNTPPEGFHVGVVLPSSHTSAESSNLWDDKREKRETTISEVELMKERFSKLLLGEDMSGSGKGVCTALAISNAITNLAASVFGELWRLEPLSPERKVMWHREMEWLLSVGDHFVEFVPSFQSISDGSSLEVMISRPRSDLHINLPALHKLDAMLLETLDSFKETEFWYVDQGVSVGAQNNQKAAVKRQEDKWWLPVPKIPTGGLSDNSRKDLQYQRDCTSQILKAAMAINEQVLSEMQVPEVYWDSLPKSAKTSLGETLYHGLESEHFYPDALLSSLDLSTEHNALNVANRVQSAIHVWRRKVPSNKDSFKDGKSSSSRYPWVKVRDLVADCGKRLGLIERAESLLLSLRQRFPGLPQTVLDVNKIQFNKDVGQAILESYSRVLESLAFSILARIDDVLYIADLTKRNQAVSRGSTRKMPAPFSDRISTSTPYVTPFASPGSSPSLSPSPRRPNNSPSADEGGGGSAPACPFLASLCSVESCNVRDVKRPAAAKERPQPWSDIEYRKSFYSPPGRD